MVEHQYLLELMGEFTHLKNVTEVMNCIMNCDIYIGLFTTSCYPEVST